MVVAAMLEPGEEVSDGDSPDGSAERRAKRRNGPLLCALELGFDEAPQWFDRVEIGRVWRQQDELGACGVDELPGAQRLVRQEVVQKDDVALSKLWDELMLDEVDEPGRIHRSDERALADDRIAADRRDGGDVPAPVVGAIVVGTVAAQCPRIGRRHREVAARFVEEDQPLRRDRLDPLDETDSAVVDVQTIKLRGSEAFFFQVSCARLSARNMADRLSWAPRDRHHSRRSSSTVRSGASRTKARNSGSSSSAIFAGIPPACASGSTLPRSRCLRSTLDTVASPIPNSSAISTYVPAPARYASTRRPRRSDEVARAINVFDHAAAISASDSWCSRTER